MKATFQEFCEDYLDQHIALMTPAQIAEARADYNARCAIVEVKVKSKFASLSAAALRDTIARHVNSQTIAISRSIDPSAISLAQKFIDAAAAAKTKQQMIAALDMSADVSRAFAKKGA